MMYQSLLTSLDDGIFTITINRPDKLNALNKMVMDELNVAVKEVYENKEIRSAIITGAGQKAFVAGADISEFLGLNAAEGMEMAKKGQTIFSRIENCPKPIVAAVNGFALGGGCELAMVCDIRIASSNAKMGQPEVTIGIPPGWGGTQRLLRIVGPAKAKELVFTGKMITAEEALQIGLVNKVVSLGSEDNLPPEVSKDDAVKEKKRSAEVAKILNKKLIQECLSLAKEIKNNSFTAVKVSKMLINKGMDVDIDSGLRLEIYGWALCFAHEDRSKMMSAFLNKGKK